MALSTPPLPAETPAAAFDPVAEVSAAFRASSVPPSPLSPLYRLAMGSVAVVMVLLPLIYLALIFAAGAGVWWYAVNANDWIGDLRGRAYVFAYVAPLFTGAVLLFFMVKPLLARPPKAPEPILLDRAQEPAIWALVERICAAVRAPVPRTIAVDADVNASASFERGWLGFFTGNLRLTIGLPLVTGLRLDELAGVLAHEFGHFAQGGGMRVSFVVRSISGWFARVVYERDSWDQRLASVGEAGGWVSLLTIIAMAMVWLGRRILWCLMWVGYAVSSYLMRQMEYDADSYEARLVGSKTTVQTSERIVELSVAAQRAWNIVGENFQQGRVPGDLPGLIASCAERMPTEVKQQLKAATEAEKTGLFDTHPTTRDRNAAALRLAQEGIFHTDRPATLVFNDFANLAQAVTQHRYEVVAGVDLSKLQIAANAAVVASEDERMRTFARVDDLFRGLLHPVLPLPLAAEPPADEQAAARLPALLARLRETVDAAAPAIAAWRESQIRTETQQAIAVLLAAGCDRFAGRIEGADTKAGGIAAYEKLEAMRKETALAAAKLGPALAAAATFLDTAITAHVSTYSDSDDESRTRVQHQWRALVALASSPGEFRRLHEYNDGLAALFSAAQEEKDHERLTRVATSMAALARKDADEVFRRFQNVPCPLPDAPPNTATLRDYFLPEAEDGEPAFVTTFRRVNRLVEAAPAAMQRLVGDLLNATLPEEPAVAVEASAPATTNA